MTYDQIVEQFLEKVAEIKASKPAYKQPGDGSNGVCDCIGLIIGAIRRIGLKWTGIHGSNYAARYQAVNLKYIKSESQLNVGDIVFKGVASNGKGKRPCYKGTFSHKYDLPSRYEKGKQYYTGDLIDYYHVGVVTQVNPLNITHMTTPSVKVDKKLDQMTNSPWNYVAKVKPLVNEAPIPTSASTPSTGMEAIVSVMYGTTVNLRQYPSKSCKTYIRVPVGTKVLIIAPGEEWAQIDYGTRKGWYMMAEFLDVIGDGKGNY